MCHDRLSFWSALMGGYDNPGVFSRVQMPASALPSWFMAQVMEPATELEKAWALLLLFFLGAARQPTHLPHHRRRGQGLGEV